MYNLKCKLVTIFFVSILSAIAGGAMYLGVLLDYFCLAPVWVHFKYLFGSLFFAQTFGPLSKRICEESHKRGTRKKTCLASDCKAQQSLKSLEKY